MFLRRVIFNILLNQIFTFVVNQIKITLENRLYSFLNTLTI